MSSLPDNTGAASGVELLRELERDLKWTELRDSAVELLAAQPDSGSLDTAWLCYYRARAEVELLDAAAALSNYGMAAELFALHGDVSMELRSEIGLARAHLVASSMQQGLHVASRCAERAAANGLDYELHLARLMIGRALSRDHRYAESVELLRGTVAFFDPVTQETEWTAARQFLAWSLIGLGELEAGEQLANENVERLRADPRRAAELQTELNGLIFAAWCRGDFQRVRDLHTQLLGPDLLDPRPSRVMVLYYNKALAEIALELYTDAKRNLHRAWDCARKQGDFRLVAPAQMALALIAIHEREPEQAVSYAELARRNMHEQLSEEPALINYYLALAYLAAGMTGPAQEAWQARRQLELSYENAVELDWLLRALDTVEANSRPADDPAAAAARSMIRVDLAALNAVMPRHPASVRPG